MSTVIAARLVAPPLTVDARVIIHSLDGELEHLNQQFGTVLAINENIYDIRLADDNEVQLSPENLDSVDGLPPATERPVLLVPTPEAEPAVRIIEALDRLHSTARGEGGGVAAVEMLCEVMKPFFAEHDEYLMQFRTDAVGRRERAIERHTLDGEERWAADELKRFEKLLGEQQSEEQILQDIIVTFLAEQYKGGVDLTYLQQRWAAEKAKAARVQTAVEEYEEARRREEGDHDGEDSADEDEKEASESAEVADEVAGIYGGLGGQQQQRLDDARALQKTLPSVKGTKFLTTCDLVVRNGLDEFSISALEEHAARVVQLGEDSSVTATRKGDEDLSLTFVVGDAAFAKTVWQWHRWASLGIVDQLLPEGLVVVRATASEPVMTRTRADDFDAIGCAFCKIIGDPRCVRGPSHKCCALAHPPHSVCGVCGQVPSADFRAVLCEPPACAGVAAHQEAGDRRMQNSVCNRQPEYPPGHGAGVQ